MSENKNFKLIKRRFWAKQLFRYFYVEVTKKIKKYLEIYSDLTKPLLTEYGFFKGLTGGKLLFSSIFEKESSSSKLTIENFKVVNAPGMVKLLSLADLGGLADLAEGEGISLIH